MKTWVLLLFAFICIGKCNYDQFRGQTRAAEKEQAHPEINVTSMRYKYGRDTAIIWLDENGKPFAAFPAK